MLFTTLRQLASISGRTIVVIGLTSATVLALAPSAKADNVFVDNAPVTTYAFTPSTATGATALDLTGADSGTLTGSVGSLNVKSNDASGYTVSISGSHDSGLVKAGTTPTYIAYKVTVGSLGQTTNNVTTSAQTKTASAPSAAALTTGDVYDITIQVDKSALLGAPSGEYSGTLTLTAVNRS